MKKQVGFTLIELVIVVVILGFLAVTAIPKFIDLTDQAKQANIEGVAGGFATAVSLTRAQWEAEGRPKDDNGRNVIEYDGTEVLLTTEEDDVRPGYIVSSTGGANSGAGLGNGFTDANCIDIWNSIFQQPATVSNYLQLSDDTDYVVSKSGDGAGTTCHYYLKETLTKDGDGDYSNPGISTDTGNSFTYQPATSDVVIHINIK